MSEPAPNDLETDSRFPSGKWGGFFLQKHPPLGRQPTELWLTFRAGEMNGEGRDIVGEFTLRGRYQVADGRCYWTKRYLGKHDVFYSGFNEGKGIWGVWEIVNWGLHGGFHIWPEGMANPTDDELAAAADVPAEKELVGTTNRALKRILSQVSRDAQRSA